MAAAEIESSFASSGGGPRPLTRTRDILIETMQLVEPRKDVQVPNHLLESKVYSKLAKNQVIQAQPSVVHFGGFEPGVTVRQVIDLANVSTEVQRMHIIPPQTKYFYVKYTKGDRLVPGLAVQCTIEFTPDEWRYYYDCIRVHCKGEENLVIPIHAYPVMNTSDFPSIVTFPPVPVGHSRSKVLPLRCQAPIDFEFQLTCIQPHPAFRVEPMAGIVPAGGETDVIVTFSPSEFCTALMRLQLVISQFNAKPIICSFTGSSGPGLAKQITEKIYSAEQVDYPGPPLTPGPPQTLDPRAISPLDRSRRNKKQAKVKKKTPVNNAPKEVQRGGIMFPADLDTPYAVAQVLNQQPGKLRIKDLRQVVLSKKGNGSGAPTRQMKEALFEMAVRRDVYEERQNTLRWQVKVGADQITDTGRQDVLESRGAAWEEYKRARGDPVPSEESSRGCTACVCRRTRRPCDHRDDHTAMFDVYQNDPWAVKHAVMDRFQQAARKIIVRLRASRRLRSLRHLVMDWGTRKIVKPVDVEVEPSAEDPEDPSEDPPAPLHLQMATLRPANFPTYVAPHVKDDMAVDSLGPVPYQPTEVVVKKKVPYHDLKVPQQYVLLSYCPHSVHSAAQGYVPPALARPLRSGAQEEQISLTAVPPPPSDPVIETDLSLEDVDTPPPSSQPITDSVEPIRPPAGLLQPIHHPALHIFNPAPGLQVYQPPLPYAETHPDYHLCPLPRYSTSGAVTRTGAHTATQKVYLDREDTIRGVMSWKKFPSQGLTSLTNTPTMSEVWAPRWSDPFTPSLLPAAVPELYQGLPEDDGLAVSDEGDDQHDSQENSTELVTLTPDMVLAEFPLIDTSSVPEEKPHKKSDADNFPFGSRLPVTNIPVSSTGPVSREKREQELDHFLKKKYNRLGQKITAKVQHQDSLKTNAKLVLK